jgi:hypothetical protein
MESNIDFQFFLTRNYETKEEKKKKKTIHFVIQWQDLNMWDKKEYPKLHAKQTHSSCRKPSAPKV